MISLDQPDEMIKLIMSASLMGEHTKYAPPGGACYSRDYNVLSSNALYQICYAKGAMSLALLLPTSSQNISVADSRRLVLPQSLVACAITLSVLVVSHAVTPIVYR